MSKEKWDPDVKSKTGLPESKQLNMGTKLMEKNRKIPKLRGSGQGAGKRLET